MAVPSQWSIGNGQWGLGYDGLGFVYGFWACGFGLVVLGFGFRFLVDYDFEIEEYIFVGELLGCDDLCGEAAKYCADLC